MANNIVTLILNGEVSLDEYSKAIHEFNSLINNLQKEYAPDGNIIWEIDNLEFGSAIASARGEVEVEDEIIYVENVVNQYERVAERTIKGDLSEFSEDIQNNIKNITSIINGRVQSIRFETNNTDWEISKRLSDIEELKKSIVYEDFIDESSEVHFLETYGVVKGRVQAMSREKQYRFTLYDLNDHRAISCFLNKDFEEDMRNAWGKLAEVEGIVRRDLETGKPTTVKQVKRVNVIEEGKPGGWRKAFGCAPNYTGGVPPEEAIRKIRDA